jgi:DUF438 domain-containing protein
MTEPHNLHQRQQQLVKILTFLSNGGNFDQAKQLFDQEFANVDVAEITAAERELIANGLDPREIQKLCNVHVALFKDAIAPGKPTAAFDTPGHPVYTLKLENKIIDSLINDELLPCLKKWQQDGGENEYLKRMQQALKDLMTIDRHYARKENTLFPLMDKYGITAPPKVMWGVDDEQPLPDKYVIEAAVEKATQEVLAMIVKEEDIMLPMLAEVATPADWARVRADENSIGYTLISPPINWQPTEQELADAANKPTNSALGRQFNEIAKQLAATDAQVNQITQPNHQEPAANLPVDPQARIDLATGQLSPAELIAIFKLLPVDLTFVDAADQVRWYSDIPDRIFPRTKSVIGRSVYNCHPPKAQPKVKKILTSFHEGTSDREEFWFSLHGERFIHLEYIAVRREDGTYLGCLEVGQDATYLRSLKDEKRR